MIQKHISSKNTDGQIIIDKDSLADLAELVRCSPNSCRLLFLLLAYADSDNSVISNVDTLSKMLGISKEHTSYALKNLITNGYIELKTVKLNHKKEIYGVEHDKNLYRKSHKHIWKAIDKKYITTFKLKEKYNRFYINDSIIKCKNNKIKKNNIILSIANNLFYNTKLNNNEIIWEL